MKSRILFMLVLTLGTQTYADLLILINGQVVTGTILQREDNCVLVKLDYGTARYPDSMIKEVRKDEVGSQGQLAEEPERVPNWGKIVSELAKRNWASEIKQIPATVIDKGILKDVPYMSFRAGSAYELNIYGDPDGPAGFEIGVQKFLVNDSSAKSNCVELVSALLVKKTDSERVTRLNWARDSVTIEDLTLEITPPEDEDAYRGWWISVYNRESLTKAQASRSELHQITEYKSTPVYYTPRASDGFGPGIKERPTTWSPSDYSYAPSYRGGYTGGGPVYVRSYLRRDGAFVRAHTRRR